MSKSEYQYNCSLTIITSNYGYKFRNTRPLGPYDK